MSRPFSPIAPRGARQRRSRGFTLLELMVTISVAAILLALAAPSFTAMRQNSQLTSTANAFAAALTAARSEAMSRQLNTMVRPWNGTDWTSGWRVYADVNFNSVYDEGTDVPITSEIGLGTGFTVPVDTTLSQGAGHYVKFSGSGFMLDTSTGNPAVQAQKIDFKYATKTRRVILNAAGRLRVCDPDPGKDVGCDIDVGL